MRKNIRVVIGSNFGDEGKGLAVDYYCSNFTSPVLNVRYNGGAQAGHTVVTPEGYRFVFSHFGAGSFNPYVHTYLTRDFIINPMLFWREREQLNRFNIHPKVYIHKDCKITTPYDMLINQIIENHRGNNRHGSCGLGIFETVNRENSMSLTVDKIRNNREQLITTIIQQIQKEWVPERLNSLQIDEIPNDLNSYLSNKTIQTNWTQQLLDMISMIDVCEVVDDSIMDKYQNIVFEGAQGLLLDQNNMIFFPNLTPSNTGMKNVLQAMNNARITQDADIDVTYVTRTYFTRHGAGLFPSECSKSCINSQMIDITNKPNPFQGDLRYGYFDEQLFKTAINTDIKNCDVFKDNFNFKFNVIVTHLNETGNSIKLRDKEIVNSEIVSYIKSMIPEISSIGISDGTNRNSVNFQI